MGVDDHERNSRDETATVPEPGPRRVSGPFHHERYRSSEVIGRGGMGEVVLANDEQLGREVAIKLIRGEPSEVRVARFMREARIQARLDHPAIPPVHELGRDRLGQPFLVMKRLSGSSLSDILKRRLADEAVRVTYSRQRLLRAFADVCLAIGFAHVRNVVHRDIKPANIMLGDYGEVYVLDWGIAKVLGQDDDRTDETVSGEHETREGTVLGTPAYMAPEQAQGQPIDGRADVYALGRVLRELLETEPQTIPELTAVVELATEPDADERAIDARGIAAAIHAYLDGDRDLARRRQLAEEHAKAAREALTGQTDAARATAVHEAGRALALDPANSLAQQVLGHTLLSNTAMPAGALANADRERAETRRDVLRYAAGVYYMFGLAVLSLLLFPFNDFRPVALGAALCLVAGTLAFVHSRRTLPLQTRWSIVYFAIAGLGVASASWMFGTFTVMPVFLVGVLAIVIQQPTRYSPWLTSACVVVPPLAFYGLELVGAVPSTISVAGGEITLRSNSIDFTPANTAFIFALAIVGQCINLGVLAYSMRRSQERAQDRVHALTWHLQQLLPDHAS